MKHLMNFHSMHNRVSCYDCRVVATVMDALFIDSVTGIDFGLVRCRVVATVVQCDRNWFWFRTIVEWLLQSFQHLVLIWMRVYSWWGSDRSFTLVNKRSSAGGHLILWCISQGRCGFWQEAMQRIHPVPFFICGDTGFSERFSAYCPALVAYNNLEGELLVLGFCTLTRITWGDFGPFASLISKGSSWKASFWLWYWRFAVWELLGRFW